MSEKCGCIRGHYLCPEAVRLWRRVGSAYEEAIQDDKLWPEYEKAQKEYKAHFGTDEVHGTMPLR